MKISRNRRTRRQGAILVLMIVMLPVVLLLCAFAINLAYMELNRTELHAAADAAARAGGREFILTGDQTAAIARAQTFAESNEVGGDPLTLGSSNMIFGTSTRASVGTRYNFTPGGSNPNSLKVVAARNSSSPDGPIPLLMPNLLGINDFSTEHEAVSTQLEVDVALVIDRSGSMAYADTEVAAFPPAPYSAPPGWFFCDEAPPDCRWRDVVAAIGVFLDEVAASPADERVSISTYNSSAITNQDLTTSYGSILTSIAPYTTSFCAGGTNIGGGINEGSGVLANSPNSREEAAKVIIVMTDGIHNTGMDPISVASAVAADGVMIHTVTFSNEANQATMQQVATVGFGKHFHANTASDLIAIFEEIAKQLPTLLTQ